MDEGKTPQKPRPLVLRCLLFTDQFLLHESEGVNAVYIKDLRRALEDGDPIRAVIRGTSVNCDGRTPGMLMPSSAAQEALIRRAYSQAGLHNKMNETAFVECHGTGTTVGDPLETAAVAQCFGAQGVIITSVRTMSIRRVSLVLLECVNLGADHPSQVKPNVGHSEGAAGLTSLIKAILAIEHRLVPPNIYFDNPNPASESEHSHTLWTPGTL